VQNLASIFDLSYVSLSQWSKIVQIWYSSVHSSPIRTKQYNIHVPSSPSHPPKKRGRENWSIRITQTCIADSDLLKFDRLVHYGPRDQSPERLAGRAASSVNAALIATFSSVRWNALSGYCQLILLHVHIFFSFQIPQISDNIYFAQATWL